MMYVLEPCRECREGKHGNCNGETWNEVLDNFDDCPCHGRQHKAPDEMVTDPETIRASWDDDEPAPPRVPARVPPPGDLTSDQALARLRDRLTNPEGEDRRGRYHAAIRSGPLDAVLRLVDEEHAALAAEIEAMKTEWRADSDVWEAERDERRAEVERWKSEALRNAESLQGVTDLAHQWRARAEAAEAKVAAVRGEA